MKLMSRELKNSFSDLTNLTNQEDVKLEIKKIKKQVKNEIKTVKEEMIEKLEIIIQNYHDGEHIDGNLIELLDEIKK